MHSLRARLVAGLLALAAIGLVALAGITYAEQRSFLLDRVDQQLRGAAMPLARALAENGVGAAPGSRPEHREPDPGAPDDRAPDGGPSLGLPPGAFGQRRDASGATLGSVILSYGDEDEKPSAPELPRTIRLGHPFTVDAVDGSSFRALATPEPDGGMLVAAIPLHEVDETLERLLVVEALVIAGVLLVLGVGAWFVVRLGLRPLDRIEQTAGEIASGDLSQRVASTDPRTEVGRLGIALNAMLDQLEQAFAARQASEGRLRRFLADASHELRTPLAAIRGYAELDRIGATSDPVDRERAVRRIEEEAARMGVLVQDLLTLARLDEVREAQYQDLDLAALARDVVEDARVAASARALELHAAGPVMVHGDAGQLRQVLANLVRNALVHTAPDVPIEVSVAAQDGTASVAVRDHGQGLPPGPSSQLFERFWRSERGRERGKGGAGLGLAIAAEIVAAHGGRVAAANAPDGGAVFTVELPVATRRDP